MPNLFNMTTEALIEEAKARRVQLDNTTDRQRIIELLQAGRFYIAARAGVMHPSEHERRERIKKITKKMNTTRIKTGLQKLGVRVRGRHSRDEYVAKLVHYCVLLEQMLKAPAYDPVTKELGVQKQKRDLAVEMPDTVFLKLHPKLEPRADRPAMIAVPHKHEGVALQFRRECTLPECLPGDKGKKIKTVMLNSQGESRKKDLLSRVHCQVEWRPNGKGGMGLFLQDGHGDTQHASSNGSAVGGLLVAANGIVPLTIGSTVEMGTPHLMVCRCRLPPAACRLPLVTGTHAHLLPAHRPTAARNRRTSLCTESWQRHRHH